MRRRDFLRATLAAPAVLAAPSVRGEAAYPSAPIRLIWPGGGGGGPYAIVRMIAQQAEKSGPNIVVEDRPGAVVGSVAVKQAAPDGYTILLGRNSTHAANVTLIKDLPYDPATDFEAVTLLFVLKQALLVPGSLGVTTIKELRELAHKKPGGLSYASPGMGSAAQLMSAQLAKAFGVPMTHVPYRSSAAARPDLLTGRVDMLFNTTNLFKGDIESGKIRAIAAASRERLPTEPNLQTLAEQGYPDIEIESWSGIFAPAKTPPDRLDKLNTMFVAAAQSVSDRAAAQGFFIKTSTRAEFAELVKSDIARLGKIIREVGAAPQ
jgi:tripartite-type tricarboxylate transporter receptor subunit TctC